MALSVCSGALPMPQRRSIFRGEHGTRRSRGGRRKLAFTDRKHGGTSGGRGSR
jgi:hypothetical protein